MQLQPESIDAAVLLSAVSDPVAGGIALFLGTTRSEKDMSGQELAALDYEAYGEMAARQLKELARQVRERWPVLRVAIVHRIGRVVIGQPSVAIAVSSPHRAEAFEACRWLIDTLKSEVAIWKKEIWADGSGLWSEPKGGGAALVREKLTRGNRGDAGTRRKKAPNRHSRLRVSSSKSRVSSSPWPSRRGSI